MSTPTRTPSLRPYPSFFSDSRRPPLLQPGLGMPMSWGLTGRGEVGVSTAAGRYGSRPTSPQGKRLLTCGAMRTNAFGCKNNMSKRNINHLQLAFPSSSEDARRLTICRAQSEDSKGGGGFLTGFLIGGAIFGTLGYVFAPQISRTLDTLLDDNGQDGESDENGLQRVARPRNGRYYDEGLEKTRQTLGDKISQLNLAIDKAASRLKRVTGNVENEAAKDEAEIEISSLNNNEHVVENLNEQGYMQGESAT